MATGRTVRSTGRNTTMAMALTAVLLTALIGALLLVLRTPAPARPLEPATSPAAPAVLAIDPAQQGVMGSTQPHSFTTPAFSPHNRRFADEVAGAGAQDVDPANLTGPLPERLQDLAQPAALPVAEPLVQPSQHNRFFADELAAGAGVADQAALDLPSVSPQRGPR